MNALLIILALATFASTLIGGLIALKYKKHLPYFFAFAAGSLVAVAFLDLLPESIGLASNSGLALRDVMITVIISFFIYSLFERFFPSHDLEKPDSHGHIMGPIGAGSLVLHSFLDGAVIGAAFQVNTAVGIIVALAVLFHDFTDGINTVTIMLKNKHNEKNAKIFLILDAIAPVLGVLFASLIAFSKTALAIILAVFVGEFIYIGVASLLPETYHHKSKKIILAMAAAILLIIILTHFLS